MRKEKSLKSIIGYIKKILKFYIFLNCDIQNVTNKKN